MRPFYKRSLFFVTDNTDAGIEDILYIEAIKGGNSMIYTVYAEKDDMTFIMEETENTITVRGFYFGEPDDEATKKYIGGLIAFVEW